jgi:diphthine-ammonia ligase
MVGLESSSCTADQISAPDEMDSWMYQTVGHDVVPLYAQAMDLPMYRQIINGTNVETELHYNQSAGDETEDLLQLLVKVKDHHPDVSAVSVGAIASNYQRLRVEHVASRLGLTVLAYMWEQDQSRLLQSMCDSGLVAILIKVAAIGKPFNMQTGADARTKHKASWQDISEDATGSHAPTLSI